MVDRPREVEPKRPGHPAQARDGSAAAARIVTLSTRLLECKT
jgi:hypothetical protein